MYMPHRHSAFISILQCNITSNNAAAAAAAAATTTTTTTTTTTRRRFRGTDKDRMLCPPRYQFNSLSPHLRDVMG
jgi:hypothetical protein